MAARLSTKLLFQQRIKPRLRQAGTRKLFSLRGLEKRFDEGLICSFRGS